MTRSGAEVVRAFFDAYRDHDVDRMMALCTPVARIEYVPMGDEGEGPVTGIGKALWAGLLGSFPDLTTEVRTVLDDDHGRVAAEVVLRGTQGADYAGIESRGRHFSLPQGFFFDVADGRVDRVAAYWDDTSFRRQLQ